MASGCRGSRKVCNSTSKHCAICPAKGCIVDALDATLLDLFAKEPRIGVLEASRRLGVARGTVQARRSEESRVGKECVRTCRSRGSPSHVKKTRRSRVDNRQISTII